jgi:hypothetical protein
MHALLNSEKVLFEVFNCPRFMALVLGDVANQIGDTSVPFSEVATLGEFQDFVSLVTGYF